MDQKKSEVAELGRTKEKLSARVDDLEQQMSDLQEQVLKLLVMLNYDSNFTQIFVPFI